MPDNRFKKLVDGLVQQGANLAVWGCVLIALVEAGSNLPPGLLVFVSSVGGNLVANILDRASKGEEIDEVELSMVLQKQEELHALQQAITQFRLMGEDLNATENNIKAAVMAAREGSRQEHIFLYEQIVELSNSIKHMIAPPANDEAKLQQARSEYVNLLRSSRHRRMSTGGIVAEAPNAASQIREPFLEDTFVEPHVVGAEAFQKSHADVDRLLVVARDEDVDDVTRNNARQRLLRLRSDTWEEMRKRQEPSLASKVINKYSALVFLGDPGAGKSTLIRWLLMERVGLFEADVNATVPFIITVGDYANAWKSAKDEGYDLLLSKFIEDYAEKLCDSMGAIVRHALLEKGVGVFLMLDGLDEVPRDLRRAVVNCIQDFISMYVGEKKTHKSYSMFTVLWLRRSTYNRTCIAVCSYAF